MLDFLKSSNERLLKMLINFEERRISRNFDLLSTLQLFVPSKYMNFLWQFIWKVYRKAQKTSKIWLVMAPARLYTASQVT